MANRRVVVTGIGLVSPIGLDRVSTWKNVLDARSGAASIGVYEAKDWPTNFACEINDFELDQAAIGSDLTKFLNRPGAFGAQAAYEAMTDSGVHDGVDPERFGISIGASIGAVHPAELAKMLASLELSEEYPQLRGAVETASNQQFVMRNHPGTLAALLSSHWNALGPLTTIHTACASSGQSLGQAYLQISRGEADVILTGGADSLAGELLLAGFSLLGALSRRNDDPMAASRPFDRERDGFVASEGAAMLVLEEEEHARRRGAKIYAEFAGYGETASAYRVTDLPENGRGVVEAMTEAVQDAGVPLEEVDYINAHGTSTELNDRIEALAIRRVFGARGVHPMVSSTKSELGHLISAAGAMEAAFCALAVNRGAVPPTRNLYDTDCGDDIDFVAHEARETPVRCALSNSIGFGGSNSVVAMRRYAG